MKIFPTWKRKWSIKPKRHRVPYRINPRRNTPRHILIKLTKTKHKERIFKQQGRSNKGNPICLTADLSAETLQARRQWKDIFKAVKEKNIQTTVVTQGERADKTKEVLEMQEQKNWTLIALLSPML